jgi:hypothetical protein
MILYLTDPENSTILLQIINSFSSVAGYKISIQKSVAFLYTNNAQTQKEIREFKIALKIIKYLRINLTKETKNFFKLLNRDVKEDIKRSMLMDQ